MVVANSNNCSNCSTHECVNRQRMFFSHRPYLCASLSTNSSNKGVSEMKTIRRKVIFSRPTSFLQKRSGRG